jgi:hypothetical protein
MPGSTLLALTRSLHIWLVLLLWGWSSLFWPSGHPHEPVARWLAPRFGIPSHNHCTVLFVLSVCAWSAEVRAAVTQAALTASPLLGNRRQRVRRALASSRPNTTAGTHSLHSFTWLVAIGFVSWCAVLCHAVLCFPAGVCSLHRDVQGI